MNVFQAERESIAGKLTAAGVAAVTLDPSAALPHVLVDLPRVTGSQGVGGWSAEFRIQIAAPPPGDTVALAWMLDQLEPVLATLSTAYAEPQTVTRNDVDVPAYVVAVTRSLSNPNC